MIIHGNVAGNEKWEGGVKAINREWRMQAVTYSKML
jgi:hypothetical protein